MRKAILAFSLSLCLFLTLSCTQNDVFLLEEQTLQEKENFQDPSMAKKTAIDFDGIKNGIPTCTDAIVNLNYHPSNAITEDAIVLAWLYVKPSCNGICPPPGLLKYDIEVQVGSIGTYGAFWGTTYSFSHIESSAETELMHYAAFEDIGGEPELIRFRVRLNTCSEFSDWKSNSPKFQ